MPAPRVPLAKGGNKGTIGTPLTLALAPRIFRVRLTGMLFDTDKCFLLPPSLKAMRSLKGVWDAHPAVKVLVVGHADRAGAPDHNQKLSERRAEAIVAFLRDDVDAWMRFYDPGVPPTKIWGAAEDEHMVSHFGFASVADYQGARGLDADGVAGPKTRRALVTEYLSEDATTLPPSAEVRTHGCGESHPEVPTADGAKEDRNRRVEIFLFEGPIDPPQQNPCPQPGGCSQHAKWKKGAVETIDLGDGADGLEVRLRLHDPQGEPMAGARCVVALAEGAIAFEGTADASGFVAFENSSAGATCRVSWSRGGADLPAGTFQFERTFALMLGTSDGAVLRRLANLGFRSSSSDAENIGAFQEAAGLPVTGVLADARAAIVAAHDAFESVPVKEPTEIRISSTNEEGPIDG